MFNVCPGCGEYSEEKIIIAPGIAECPHCRHRHTFRMLPLFVLTGASGTGKTTVCQYLVHRADHYVAIDSDILWRPEFEQPEEDWRTYRNLWLRLAKNIGQAGKPVLLGGSAVPSQFEACPERRYFSAIHYLALVCDGDALAERLSRRPAWRGRADDGLLKRMLEFNRWLRDNAASTDPPMTLLDTTELTLPETARQVDEWAEGRT